MLGNMSHLFSLRRIENRHPPAALWFVVKVNYFGKVFMMAVDQYRIESRDTLKGSLLLSSNFQHLYTNPSLAVAVAVKSMTDPTQQEVRVVHIASGEIIFRTTAEG